MEIEADYGRLIRLREMEMIERWERDAERFDGDQALFWAGRMSIAAGIVVRSDVRRLPGAIELLNECRERYDAIIFEEARTRK